MLPGGGFNGGFNDDVRGFRKKNRPARVFQRYAPFLAVFELIALVVSVIVLRSSANHAHQQLATLRPELERLRLDSKTLLTSLQQERQARTSTEAFLRDANAKLTAAQRELADTKSTSSQQDAHCKSLQDSFDHTRLALEGERDAARLELNMANQRINSLQSHVTGKEKELDEAVQRNAEEHRAKDKRFESQMAEWEAMRRALTSQIRSQGGWIPQSPPPSDKQQPTDYAAKTGTGVFHLSHDGQRERFIDSAEDLEREGVVDPEGRVHLAQLLGHLYEIKMAEFAQIEQSHPGSAGQPRPPIGQWMAQTLEGLGITCKYGTVHMGYILDRHFALEGGPSMVGRGAQTAQPPPGQEQAAQAASATTQQAATPPLQTPGVVNPENHDAERHSMNAWRLRNQRHGHQKVDAAGFV